MRFGIDVASEHTLEEVGKDFSVTRERIRQIEVKALRKLRHPSRSKKLQTFFDKELNLLGEEDGDIIDEVMDDEGIILMEPIYDSSGLYYNIILFIISLGFCALFSFIETSITGLRLFKLKELAKLTGKYKKLFDTLENNPHRVLITILIANNLANVTAATLSSQIMETLSRMLNLSEGVGFTLGIAITTIAILIFGEVIPKNIAKLHGEKLFKSTLWFINIVVFVFYPVVTVLVSFANKFMHLLGGKEYR